MATGSAGLLKQALAYAERGWPVLPLHATRNGRCTCGKADCKSPGKHPRTRTGLSEATDDADVIRAWWDRWDDADVGVTTGAVSGLVVVDLDPGADVDALDLPATLSVATPRGGRHLYYAHPGGHIKNNNSGLVAEHVDVRGDGGYVVAPPSVINGKSYKSQRGTRKVGPLPLFIVEALVDSGGEARESSDGSVTVGSRHNQLLSLAGWMRAKGHDGAAIENVLMAFNETACDPPKPVKEVRHLARDIANRYDAGDADTEFEEAVGKRVRDIEISEAARRQVASKRAGEGYVLPAAGRTLADDLAEPRRERKYTIDRLHPAGGNSLLVAQYKTGKTTLLLNLMKSLAEGTPFLGEFETNLSGRVAFWNYELDDDMFRDWAREVGVSAAERVAQPLHLRGRSLRLWESDIAATTIEWLKANEVEFLIVDPAARAWRGLVTDENDNAQVAEFTDALDTIKREAGVKDLVLATHMGRASFDEDAERARGATRLEDWMDAGWYLTKEKGSGARSLRAAGRDVEVSARILEYDDSDRSLKASGQTRDEHRLAEGAMSVLDALGAVGEGAKTNAVTEAMTGDRGRRSAAIKHAIQAGLIRREYEDGTPVNENAGANGKPKLLFFTEAGQQAQRRKVRRPATSAPKPKALRKVKIKKPRKTS